MRVSHIVRTATLVLPAGNVRNRYRAELEAELHALAPAARRRFMVGMVLTAWALRRAAIEATSITERPITEGASPGRSLLCRLNLHHAWHRHSTGDGHLYRRCSRCGLDDPHLGKNQLPVTSREP